MGFLGRIRSRAVGWSAAFVLAASMPLPASAMAEHEARPLHVVELDTLGGSSIAYGINDRGDVVGLSYASDFSSSHAVLWRQGRLVDLGADPGLGSGSSAVDINNHGEIAGSGYVASSGDLHAVLWRRGRMIDLGTLGGQESEALAINDRGEVVGRSQTADGYFHAFLWRHGRMIDLGTIDGGSTSWAEAIDDRGQIAGLACEPCRPVLWRRGTATALDLPAGADHGDAVDNNDRGDVVGYAGSSGETIFVHPVLWRRGTPIDLGASTGDGRATGVNNRGQVVGVANGTEAFLWQHDAATFLPGLGGGRATSAEAINDRGQIAGSSEDADGLVHAVMWR